MRPTSRTVPVVLAILLLASAAPVLSAAQPTSCRPGVVYDNGDTRVWFAGHKDFFKVFDQPAQSGGQSSPGGSDPNGSADEGAGYQYAAGDIVERDAAGNVVATMNLHSAFPQTSSCAVTTEGEFVNMTMVVTDGLTGHAGAATVGFAFHFNTSSHGGKFDLDVKSWPWTPGANHTLEYAFTLDSSSWTAEPASDGVGFRDSNGAAHGYVSWAPNATARYADGHEEQAVVNSTAVASGGHADVTLRFGNATAGYDELVYDPWMGTGDYVILAGHLVGLAPVEDLLPRGATAALHALV